MSTSVRPRQAERWPWAARPTVPWVARRTGKAIRQVFDLDQIERQAIERALIATGGNRTKAAKLLGISERTLRNKLNVPRTAIVSGA